MGIERSAARVEDRVRLAASLPSSLCDGVASMTTCVESGDAWSGGSGSAASVQVTTALHYRRGPCGVRSEAQWPMRNTAQVRGLELTNIVPDCERARARARLIA